MNTSLLYSLCILFLIAMLTSGKVLAHGGGLDAHGCHNDRKNGGYHCHRPQGTFTAQKIRKPGERGLNYYKDFQTSEGPYYKPQISKSDGICACVRNRICTGPRGGRYCINGSGNKRYLSK